MEKVEPRYNEGPREWQNMFTLTRFRYIEILALSVIPRALLYRGSLNKLKLLITLISCLRKCSSKQRYELFPCHWIHTEMLNHGWSWCCKENGSIYFVLFLIVRKRNLTDERIIDYSRTPFKRLKEVARIKEFVRNCPEAFALFQYKKM